MEVELTETLPNAAKLIQIGEHEIEGKKRQCYQAEFVGVLVRDCADIFRSTSSRHHKRYIKNETKQFFLSTIRLFHFQLTLSTVDPIKMNNRYITEVGGNVVSKMWLKLISKIVFGSFEFIFLKTQIDLLFDLHTTHQRWHGYITKSAECFTMNSGREVKFISNFFKLAISMNEQEH